MLSGWIILVFVWHAVVWTIQKSNKWNNISPHVFSSTCILIPRTQHGLHDHQGNWIWICPRSSAEGNRKLCKGNIIINYPNLNCHTKKKEGRSRSRKENESCWKDHNIKETKWCTSEPVKTAGSFATNSEAVVGSVDNLVKSFFTCSTISSCLTAPAAAITWKYNNKDPNLSN